MNFGPINQAGGERRLNVIFSRAKEHMVAVSSIAGGDITNTHNDGAAPLARFLDYAAAESRGGTGGDALLQALDGPVRPGAGDRPEDRRSAVAAESPPGSPNGATRSTWPSAVPRSPSTWPSVAMVVTSSG